MTPALVAAALAVVVGAALQRTTGLGFTLTAGPFLVLVLPPYEGVALANLLSMAVCAVVLVRSWRDVQLRRGAQIVAGAVLALLPGAYVARTLPAPALFVLIGSVVTAAGLVAAFDRPLPLLAGRPGAFLAGAASGFGNVTAGVGGPPLAVYATTTRWPRAAFVPTAQAVGLATNAMSLAAKHDARLHPATVAGFLALMLLGVLCGGPLARRMSDRVARALVLALAITGGLVAVGKGLLTW